jgi:apolipoprotein N-acyltransferase
MLYNAEKTTKTKNKFAEIVIVQPNIDPYNDKFNGALAPRQLNDFLALAQAKITPNTQLILLPETSIPGTIYINEKNWQLDTLNGFLKKYPNITIVAGALALQTYAATDTIPYTARSSGDGYYDVYNAAIAVQYNQPIEIYKKSKLVIGVEKMPYSKQISFLKKLIVDLGGTTGQLGIQDHRTAFAHKNISIAPIICYESIFGNYVADYVRQADANVFAIITNDGWWGDTPGHKQHFDYARLRAIECRRSIARSANTGISGYIDAQGDATQLLTWWQQGARVQRVALHTQRTFYVQYGDIIGIGATAVSVIFVLLMAFKKK